MIKAGSFLTETGASNKQSELVKKLTAAWEKKNSKTARAGGASLMALSLAACGGEDNTPFAQSDIDAAVAAAEAPLQEAVAAAEAAQAAAEADAAAALVAQAAAEADAAAALVAQAAAEADAAAALVAQAAAEADAAAALVAQSAAEADAAAATVAAAEATAAKEAAEAAQAAAEASLATAQADLTAKTAEYDALVVSNNTLQGQYNALVAPKSLALTNSTTADALNGGPGDDVFTGALGTWAATDSVRDTSSTDNDTLTITHNGAMAAFQVVNVENINLNINALGAAAVDAASFVGVNTLTVTRGDVVVGGATLTGDKTVDVDNVNASEVANVVAGGTATEVSVSQATAAGVTIDANAASSHITVEGAGTINANATTGNVLVTGLANATQDAKAVNINADAAAAVYVNVSTDVDGVGGVEADETAAGTMTGAVDINAAAAGTITVANATGGATIDSAKASATITVAGIDASGATINAGAGTSTNDLEVDLTGSSATSTAVDTATVNASGAYVTIDTSKASDNPINILNVGGNGAAVTATIESTNSAASTYNKVGTQSVTLAGNVSEFTGATVSGVDVLDLTAGSGAVNAALWTAGKVDLGYDAGAAITVASGQTYEITADQTDIDFDFATGSTAGNLSLVAGDDNGTSTAVGTISLGAVDTNPGNTVAGTLNIEASIANVSATSVTVGTLQNIVVTGDEDVNFGTTAIAAAGTASTTSLNASASSGIITATVAADMPTVTTGSGADFITVNNASVHSVTTNGGNDRIDITNTADTSVFSGGDGNDTFNVDDTSNFVVVGGGGNDTFNTNSALTGQIIGGDGDDTLVMDTDASTTFGATFRMSSVENLNLAALTTGTRTVTFDDETFAGNNTMVITGPSTAKFKVLADNTSGATIDASGITLASSSAALLEYAGGTKADTITGGAQDETFLHSIGADVIQGGAGTNTLSFTDSTVTPTGSANASTGIVLNMGSTAVSGTAVFAALGKYTAGNADVGTGALSYNFTANSALNLAETQTISEIQNVVGGDGLDYIVGTAGNNSINGGAAADYIDGGDGDDTITVASTAEGGSDKIHGGLGDDTINILATTTLSSTDADITGIENITLAAGAVDLTITGQDDGFVITGGTGANTIVAAGGADTITGGAGADSLTGAAGVDTFVFAAGDAGITIAAADTIADFTTADDSMKVGFAGATAAAIADGSALAAGGDAGLTSFIAAADAVLTAGTGANDDVYVSYNAAGTGHAYVVIDQDDSGSVDAGDTMIILTGVNLVGEIALADFIV